MTFENDNNEYFIVATGKDTDEYENNSVGRILVLQVTLQRRLRLVSQIKTNGMVDCLRSFNGKLLASVRGMVMLRIILINNHTKKKKRFTFIDGNYK